MMTSQLTSERRNMESKEGPKFMDRRRKRILGPTQRQCLAKQMRKGKPTALCSQLPVQEKDPLSSLLLIALLNQQRIRSFESQMEASWVVHRAPTELFKDHFRKQANRNSERKKEERKLQQTRHLKCWGQPSTRTETLFNSATSRLSNLSQLETERTATQLTSKHKLDLTLKFSAPRVLITRIHCWN